MMLAPASPGAAGPRVSSQQSWAQHTPMAACPGSQNTLTQGPPPTLEGSQCPGSSGGRAGPQLGLSLLRLERSRPPPLGQQTAGLASWGQACPLPGVSQQSALIHESPDRASHGTQPRKGAGRGSTLTNLSLYPLGQIQTRKAQRGPGVPQARWQHEPGNSGVPHSWRAQLPLPRLGVGSIGPAPATLWGLPLPKTTHEKGFLGVGWGRCCGARSSPGYQEPRYVLRPAWGLEGQGGRATVVDPPSQELGASSDLTCSGQSHRKEAGRTLHWLLLGGTLMTPLSPWLP